MSFSKKHTEICFPCIACYSWKINYGDRKLQWNVGANVSCIFCQYNIETRDHLYFDCRFSEEIWSSLPRKLLTTQHTTNWNQLLELIVDKRQEKIKLFLLRYVFQTTLHTIWKERNNMRHVETPLLTKQVINFIDKQVRNRLSTIRGFGNHGYDGGMEAWFASR